MDSYLREIIRTIVVRTGVGLDYDGLQDEYLIGSITEQRSA